MRLSSADASTAVALTIYDSDGNAVTLGSDERVILHSIGGAVATATLTIFADNDDDNTVDAGEELFIATNTAFSMEFGPEGIAGALGIPIHAIASGAGQVDFVIVGSIVKG